MTSLDACPQSGVAMGRLGGAECFGSPPTCPPGAWVCAQEASRFEQQCQQHEQQQHHHHHHLEHAAVEPALAKSWQYQCSRHAGVAALLHELKAEHLRSGGPVGVQEKVRKEIASRHAGGDDTFYIVDLGNTTRLFKAWKAAMPAVKPYYAVKCNPEPGLLRLLMTLGTGFDCASKGELKMMLSLGVPPSSIIFAHPCKRPSDILYAKEHGVQYTTFDTESELHKCAALHPGFKLVLRIRADDPGARVPLGIKYGADVADAPHLLHVAQQLGLNVVGVSFHVGSACKDLATFSGAIESARAIFDHAESLGYSMELLDVGGGFTGHFDSCGNVMFGEIANTINMAVARCFPPEMGVRVIAEPGRYFAETSAVLLTPVYGHRDRTCATTGLLKKDYWITDGLYGSFNCILYDGQNPQYQVVRSPMLPEPVDTTTTFKSTIWGPTCDSADCVYKDHELPQLRNGDWLMFTDAGAYTVAGACDFNGIEFTSPATVYVFSDSAVDSATLAAAASSAPIAIPGSATSCGRQGDAAGAAQRSRAKKQLRQEAQAASSAAGKCCSGSWEDRGACAGGEGAAEAAAEAAEAATPEEQQPFKANRHD